MTSLIRSISLENFKGFSEKVRIEIRPITLLFGANSAGKSSVLQALQYVREVLEQQNINADRTLQGGEAVDLGGFLNMVNSRDPKKQIEIAIEMELGDSSIPELVPDAFEDWQTQDKDVWWMYDALQNIRRTVKTVAVKLTIAWNEQREQPIVQGYEIVTNGEWCLNITSRLDGRDAQMRINYSNPIFMVDGISTDEIPLLGIDDFVSPADLGSQLSPSELLSQLKSRQWMRMHCWRNFRQNSTLLRILTNLLLIYQQKKRLCRSSQLCCPLFEKLVWNVLEKACVPGSLAFVGLYLGWIKCSSFQLQVPRARKTFTWCVSSLHFCHG